MDPPPPPPPPVDFLSSLAEHLQDEILRRLDLRDAVRVSALSRAWHRRWETVPGLALSFPDGTPPSDVDRVLLRYECPCVSRFATHVYGEEDDVLASYLDRWLDALSRRSVESISVFKSVGRHFNVNSSIFSCDRLVSLSLERCFIPPLPQPAGGFAGFPVLKELYLTRVDFAIDGESQLQAMIRASPMLRVLFLENVYPSEADCVIEAPNLQTLGLISNCFWEWRFGDLPRLQYASISVPACLLGGSGGFAEFVAGVSQVQELIFYIEQCNFEVDAAPLTFPNLKTMELSTDCERMLDILLMLFLLRSSPNLERLKIEVRQPETVANWEFLNAQWTDGMCANLQVVEITSAKGCLPLSFMELILSKASLLRTLSMDKCPVSQDDPLNELLNCRGASPQAQVQFKDQLEKIKFDRIKFAEKRLN